MARMSAQDMMGQFAGKTSYGAPRLTNPSEMPQKGNLWNVMDGDDAPVGSKTSVMDMDGDQDGDVRATSNGASTTLEAMKAEARATGRATIPSNDRGSADMSDMMSPRVSKDY